MVSERLSEGWDSLRESIQAQQWYQELQSKWEELDPQSRNYLQLAVTGVIVLTVLIVVLSFIFTVRGLRSEYSEKNELLSGIQSANDELKRLRESSGGLAAGEANPNWPAYIEQQAGGVGIDKAALTVSGERSGGSSDLAKELVYDVGVKHVSIKQVVRLAYAIENGSQPTKLRNLSIDAADPEGYMDATMSVSAFNMVVK